MMNETLGRWHFGFTMLGLLVTFFPMHMLGLLGMPRRVYTYQAGLGLDLWNLISTIGVGILVFSLVFLFWNLIISLRSGKPAGNDPWNAQTLEWSVSSPPPAYNFEVIPRVTSRRYFWDQKYPPESARSAADQPAPAAPAALPHHLLHPQGSIFPFIIGAGLMVASYGFVYLSWATGVGIVIMFLGIIGWVRQSR